MQNMISVHFLWFDYWTLGEWKSSKVQNHSVSVYYLITQIIGPFCDMLTVAMFIFFCEIPKYVQV